MTWYIIKRVLGAIVTLFIIMVITFVLMKAIPGSPFQTEKNTETVIEQNNKKYGLDKPPLEQFITYIRNYLHGDLGVSLKMQQDTRVSAIIFEQGKFELSIKLGISSLLLSIIVGIPLGCIAAYRRGTWLDGFLRVMTTVGVAIPAFVLATLLLLLFAVQLGWLDVNSGSLKDAKSYIMPILSMSSYYTCYIAKLTRTSMLDAINQDYIRTARAKGVKTGKLVLKHALRNSLIPVVTYLGPVAAGIITGSFVVESTFQIPGLGKYFLECVRSRDYNLIMATTTILSALVIAMNLVVDLVYRLIDPRITLTAQED
ncbi:MAG: ABC transporter permease [Clostridia bacterium]|nr:ABC transporter permease [Clostridia bacterium]